VISRRGASGFVAGAPSRTSVLSSIQQTCEVEIPINLPGRARRPPQMLERIRMAHAIK